jgi:hypothetical protein
LVLGLVLRGLLWCLMEAGSSDGVGVASVKCGHGGEGEVGLGCRRGFGLGGGGVVKLWWQQWWWWCVAIRCCWSRWGSFEGVLAVVVVVAG